nr:MAG TPA: hypothetical protein [Bacteriophage sp.]
MIHIYYIIYLLIYYLLLLFPLKTKLIQIYSLY